MAHRVKKKVLELRVAEQGSPESFHEEGGPRATRLHSCFSPLVFREILRVDRPSRIEELHGMLVRKVFAPLVNRLERVLERFIGI